MEPHRQPDPSRKGLFGSMVDMAREHHNAVKQSLEPDPNADEITRIDQEWIKQCSRLLPIGKDGLLKAPGLVGPLGPIMGIVMGALLLLPALSRRFGIFNTGAYCFAILGLVLVVAGGFGLINMVKYVVAARGYRERRAKALALRGRSDGGPLPVIDTPVLVSAALADPRWMISPAEAIARLDAGYAGLDNETERERYRQLRAMHLERATPEERSRIAAEDAWLGRYRQRGWNDEDPPAGD